MGYLVTFVFMILKNGGVNAAPKAKNKGLVLDLVIKRQVISMNVLEIHNITQEFGGLRALENVDINVELGDIFGLIGPNGAGKTTLFNLVTGIYTPTKGDIFFKNQRLNGMAPNAIASLGIGRTFQNIRLFKKQSVLDNVKVGMHGVTHQGLWPAFLQLPGARKEEKEITERAFELMAMVGLEDKAEEYADNLAYGEQRRLEIARALAINPALLLLDEPAAGMNATEKEELMQLIHDIRGMGITILLVEHDMNLVMKICTRIAVLNYGRKIADGPPETIKADERVITSYLGVGV
jgi:branched-chain amino acid transport system ATP-binding protein